MEANLSLNMAHVHNYSSLEEVIAAARKHGGYQGEPHGGDSHFMGESLAHIERNGPVGYVHNVRKAEAIFDKVDAELPSTAQREIVEDVMGAYPIVPEAMAGYPFCMRRPVALENNTAPLKIFVGVQVSAGMSVGEICNKGIASMALAMKASQMRPVELYAYGELHARGSDGGQVHILRITTAPMDTALASFVLTSREYCRRLMFCVSDQHGFDGSWPSWPGGRPTEPSYEKHLRGVLQASPEDVIIPSGHLHDREMLTNPAAWVVRRINAMTAAMHED